MAELARAELAPEKRSPRRSRKLGRILVTLLIVAVIGIAGYYIWKHFNTYETTDDAQIDGHVNAISARISGNVLEVLVNDEQLVKAGDVLVRIDPKDYEAALAKAEADL